MAARELEATGKAVDLYDRLRRINPESNIRAIKEWAANDLKISIATLNRALKRRNRGDK